MAAYLGRNLNYGYVNTVVQFPGRLDAQRLRRATRLSVDAEPILGCRFVDSWYHPYWQRRNDLDSTPGLFTLVETKDPDDGIGGVPHQIPGPAIRSANPCLFDPE